MQISLLAHASASPSIRSLVCVYPGALKAGKAALSRSADGAIVDVSVDPGPLVSLMAGRSKYSSSKRVDLLLNMSAHVTELRQLLQQRRWEQVWQNLRSHWQDLCTPNGAIGESRFFLPPHWKAV